MVPCAEGEVLGGIWVVAGGVPSCRACTRVSVRWPVAYKTAGVSRVDFLDLRWQLEGGGRWSQVLRLLIISEAAVWVKASWAVTR